MLGVLVYTFSRISTVLQMDVGDYYQENKRWWVQLHEKGGKEHTVPLHHKAEEYLDAYIDAGNSAGRSDMPLFSTLGRQGLLSNTRLHRHEALAMVKRRCLKAGLGSRFGCHTFRATGITTYLENGGELEHAQEIAAHESPWTTKLYDRTADAISLDEIERIIF